MASPDASLFADRRAREAVLQPEPRLAWRGPEPEAVAPAQNLLSGLTAGERRVHRLLLNALERENSRSGLSPGLSYAEKKRVAESLDLGFIQKEIDQMESVRAFNEAPASGREAANAWMGKINIVLLTLIIPAAVWHVFTEQTIRSLLNLVTMAALLYAAIRPLGERERLARPSTRQKIYEDLRELALALDLSDASSSPSIRRADLLIDSIAAADRAPASRPRTRS